MRRPLHKLLPPFSLPICFFGVTILAGAVLLHLPVSRAAGAFSWIDALFTATSAACVTGLAVTDTGAFFTRFGQTVILALIQLGGLGIMTYTSLVFYLLRKQVSFTDRLAVGQSLLHDPTFHLGRFLIQIVVCALAIEAAGALALFFLDAAGFTPFCAVFHSVSAFCNAGFSLFSDSLTAWQENWAVNLVFMVLIVCGGIGFSVLMEIRQVVRDKCRVGKTRRPGPALSWYAGIVLKTTAFLIIAGWAGIFFAEFIGFHQNMTTSAAALSSLFQSVTARTAGFNTVSINAMTNVSLFILIMLMFVGGASGSCAGGIKVGTFRAVTAFIGSQIKGRRQTVIGRFALNFETLNKALLLAVVSGAVVLAGAFILNITEGGDIPHPQARGLSLEIMFEVVSAYATVGLSTGLTPRLSDAGKLTIICLMFIGRLGPIVFIMAVQSYQKPVLYARPKESMLIG